MIPRPPVGRKNPLQSAGGFVILDLARKDRGTRGKDLNMTATETPAETMRMLGVRTVPTCPYCGEYLTSNEYDFEPGGAWSTPETRFYSAHFRCVQPARDGEWIVRTTQTSVTPARVSETRYTTQRRAREQAAHIREWNPRSKPCGRNLDIVVVRQPVPVA